MRTIIASGLVAGLAALATPAQAADAPATGPALAAMGKSFTGTRTRGYHRWGPRYQGRWYAGHRAPGGWVAYRRPVRGYVLPRYWVQPSFDIANYGAYGLPAPGYGYGWSRYYDDAVLTDRYGRVIDSRHDLDWDDPDDGYDDDDDARWEDGRRIPYDYGAPDDGVTYGGDYAGRWVGTWYGADGRSYSGTYEGRFEGEARPAPPAAEPHWREGHDGPPPLPYSDVYSMGAGGYVGDGYYYPAPTFATVTMQPAVTTTVVEETVSYSYPRAARPNARR